MTLYNIKLGDQWVNGLTLTKAAALMETSPSTLSRKLGQYWAWVNDSGTECFTVQRP